MAHNDIYAAPQTESQHRGDAVNTGSVWRQGNQLAFHQGAQLPDRCVKCNLPAAVYLDRTLYWHNQWLYLLICAGVLIYAIVAVFVRKKAKVKVPLCADHANRRRNGILAAWACFAGCFAVPIVASVFQQDLGVLLPLVVIGLFCAAIVLGVVFSQLLQPTRIDDVQVWTKGVGQAFLEQLPDRPS